MRLIRRILAAFRPRQPAAPRGYGAEVLFAGWVDLPAGFRELQQRAAPPARPR